SYIHEEGVAAANDERDIRLEPGEIGSAVGNPRRIEMRFVVIDAEERFFQGVGESLAGLKADDESWRKTGALGGGDRIEIAAFDGGQGKGFSGHRQQVAQVFAGGEFGDYSAVFGMQFDLRRNGIRQN